MRLTTPKKVQDQPAEPNMAPKGLDESLGATPLPRRELTTVLPPPAPVGEHPLRPIQDENEFIKVLESVGFQVNQAPDGPEFLPLTLASDRKIVVTNSVEGQSLPHPFYGTKAGLFEPGVDGDLIATIDSANGLDLDEIFGTIRHWMEPEEPDRGREKPLPPPETTPADLLGAAKELLAVLLKCDAPKSIKARAVDAVFAARSAIETTEAQTVSEKFRALVAEGLEFGEALNAFSERNDEFDEAAIQAAHDHAREGEKEVDGNAITSRGDDEEGCYVLAWTWVNRDAIAAHLPSDYGTTDEEA
jgi:hypothetical protein